MHESGFHHNAVFKARICVLVILLQSSLLTIPNLLADTNISNVHIFYFFAHCTLLAQSVFECVAVCTFACTRVGGMGEVLISCLWLCVQESWGGHQDAGVWHVWQRLPHLLPTTCHGFSSHQRLEMQGTILECVWRFFLVSFPRLTDPFSVLFLWFVILCNPVKMKRKRKKEKFLH